MQRENLLFIPGRQGPTPTPPFVVPVRTFVDPCRRLAATEKERYAGTVQPPAATVLLMSPVCVALPY
jgi:hypothetical protein